MKQIAGTDFIVDAVAIVPPLVDVFDDTANDSNKSWVVPNNEVWKLNYGHVILATTATVGNRLLTMEILNADGNMIMDISAGAVQAASLSYHYDFLQGIFRETSFVNGEMEVPLPEDCYLKGGYTLRFYDENAVDAAADDMTVAFQYMKFTV